MIGQFGDAYARGRLPNKRWSEVFDNGEYHSMEIITKDGKTYKYYPIANPQPYLTVIQEHVSTLEEPERSREFAHRCCNLGQSVLKKRQIISIVYIVNTLI